MNSTCTLLITSDIHGTVLPFNYGNRLPQDAGLAKISSLVKQIKTSSSHVLLIDNGDMIQGTPLTYHFVKTKQKNKHPIPLLMNEMGYFASVFGNHEFNYGLDLLHQVIEESQFPWLSCNILDKKTLEPYFGKPYQIHQFENGVKLALLGATTSYIPNWEEPHNIQGLLFANPVKEIQKWVKYIHKHEQVDLVAVSYHGGFEREIDSGEPTEPLTGENQGHEICMEVSGIDILITGHQHRQIPEGKINGVYVIQPGSHGTALGKMDLTLAKQENGWKLIDLRSELLSLQEVEADPQILALIHPYEDATQKWLDQPLGKIKGDMSITDPMYARTHDHPFIEWINHVQMELAGVNIANTALFDNQSPGLPTQITMRDIVANYIYPNTLKVLRLKGQDIKDALELSASYFAPYNGKNIEVNPSFLYPKAQHYNYDMWEGIQYEINISRPIGERITKLCYQGQPLDLEKEYEVVMNNYRAAGGGNYFMFQDRPVVKEIPTEVSELLADYILKKEMIIPTLNHNWRIVTD